MSAILNKFICTPKILPPVIPVIGINFFDIPNKECHIQLLYNKITGDNEEINYRISNELEIQEKRWEWIQTNPEAYINLLRKAGLSDESISAMSTRKFPLGFKNEEQYERYRSDLFKTLQQISNNSGIIGFRVIQQGSYITGYSSNPRKGDRTLPNHIFRKNSDLDLRITARNLAEYFKTINTKYETKKHFPNLIEPDNLIKVFPSLHEFSERWGKELGRTIQITVDTAPGLTFEPENGIGNWTADRALLVS